MVEQDSVDRVHVVGLAVVHAGPVAVQLRDRVRGAGVERGVLVLRRRRRAEQFRARRLVEAGVNPTGADRLQQAHRAQARDIPGVLGHVKADAHVALGAEVVDLGGLDLAEQVYQAAALGEIAVVQVQPALVVVRVLVDVVQAPGVERRRPADQAVDLVTLLQQQLGEVRAVLARDPRYQC